MDNRKIDMPLRITFRLIPLIAMRKIPNVWNRVTVMRVGTEGFRFSHNEHLEVGSLIDLKIDFPGIGYTTHCIGEIDRTEQFQQSSLFSITVKIREMERQDKEFMETIVEEMVLFSESISIIKQVTSFETHIRL
ncbi:MAG: hypothetical protein D8M57_05145 [Candidatus Scalindua sp. AMX11]|nr:MAG: hypothetical protein DWQ00_07640 [Candidatus Scalindua sp.]NOG85998.1 hypothetical protein [Planctomycetota bacterium]RZV91372.1 MAG: hypothetical protein EX341_05425 [Candidatus Scalindua sp. SCAELEC01]TDE65928.1 MAG: hypothetical protein D8M57_05145 [Candidatus Scalindua sp. AMX11]GJQ59234.1 MAG: hypothetical protein SCALA701_20350 [Candidatus Scalindua sp.]